MLMSKAPNKSYDEGWERMWGKQGTDTEPAGAERPPVEAQAPEAPDEPTEQPAAK